MVQTTRSVLQPSTVLDPATAVVSVCRHVSAMYTCAFTCGVHVCVGGGGDKVQTRSPSLWCVEGRGQICGGKRA